MGGVGGWSGGGWAFATAAAGLLVGGGGGKGAILCWRVGLRWVLRGRVVL